MHWPEGGQILMGIPVEMPPEINGRSTAGMPKYTPYKDSIKVPCDNCGRELWLGPKQVDKMYANRDMAVACCVCVIEESLRRGEDPRQLNVIPLDLFKKAGE